ncbi:transglycosylase-like protein with SLT domain [Sulfuritortus calidifontis]|uniref:Transglycosylase-like protein with SLT domain n=1 Tax=Sulfuritortus calidifontis TaxID=1914471 RepID=A0A4R3JXZ8_9PROT|nr:peptidoglycan-binding protein [Sulfuritortus calidifontis]TCS72147.1 transglycosylase-like protein with SLT domain [Sulfuritortus calidifontis]
MPHPTLRLFDGYPHTRPDLKSEVRELQTLLKQNGYAMKPDGLFGRGTEAAVMQFQSEHGLLDDGIAGPLTWARLLGEAAPAASDLPGTTYAANNPSLLAHLNEATKYRSSIETSARQYELPIALVGGLGSRESGWGLALKPAGPAGTGDFIKRRAPTAYRSGPLPPDGGGFGRGLMQIDFDAHAFARTGNWQDPTANIAYGCQVLAQNRSYLARKLQLAGQTLLQAALAAYNCGASNVAKAVQNRLDIDYYTAGRNYGRDTLDRAGFFAMHGW